MNATWAAERRGDAHLDADVPGWVVAAFLALVLFALCGAYVQGQAMKAERCAADGGCRVEAGRSWW